MKGRLAVIFVIVFASLGFSSNTAVWQKAARGIYEAEVLQMTIDPQDEQVIYAGTARALYRSLNGGTNFEVILRPSGEQAAVNDIYIPEDRPGTMYAATDAGLYASRDNGQNWERIYFSSSEESRRCLAVLRFQNTIYLGTEDGVRFKDDAATEWRAVNGRLSKRLVYHTAQDRRFIYFATGQKLYNFNKQTGEVRQVFSLGAAERLGTDENAEEPSEGDSDGSIRAVAITNGEYNDLLLGTTKGIYWSGDFGDEWRPLPGGNLALDGLTALSAREIPSDECGNAPEGCLKILAGTHKGVFSLEHGQWMPLYKGMETGTVNDVTETRRGTVYAATAKGIFYLSNGKALPFLSGTSEQLHATPAQTRNDQTHTGHGGRYGFLHEPTVNDVHAMAIHYAEVHPDKISNWRALARTRALLPDLSVGLDRDATELFHWDTGPSPDALRRGRDFLDWGVTLSWNLADLVWSTDQTTIDSRSKLMVELREDILNEVTRLYFERRRVQADLLAQEENTLFRADQEMRVAELTALIDALTGGAFSRQIKERDGESSRATKFH